MAKPGPAPHVDERPFIPRTLEEARALGYALARNGTGLPQVRGIIGWLVMYNTVDPGAVAAESTRRDYRRELGRLGQPPWEYTTS